MIEVEDIKKSYKGRPVLNGISLEVPEGSNLALIGPGGSGKSLLLKIIAGLVEPDDGEVRIKGVSVHDQDPTEIAQLREDIGMLFQNYALFDYMNVFDNIAFPLRREGELSEDQIRSRVKELLQKIDLPGIGEKYPNELSGGMKKRVSFARAIVQNPPILFYDDPSAGLDPVTSSKIFRLLVEMKQSEGTTSITISHYLSGIREICQEFAMIYEGRLIEKGPEEVFEETEDETVRRFWKGGTTDPLKKGRI